MWFGTVDAVMTTSAAVSDDGYHATGVLGRWDVVGIVAGVVPRADGNVVVVGVTDDYSGCVMTGLADVG